MLISSLYLQNLDRQITFKNTTLRITRCSQISCMNKQMLTEVSVCISCLSLVQFTDFEYAQGKILGNFKGKVHFFLDNSQKHKISQKKNHYPKVKVVLHIRALTNS